MGDHEGFVSEARRINKGIYLEFNYYTTTQKYNVGKLFSLQSLPESESDRMEKTKLQNQKLFKALEETAKSNEPIWKVKFPSDNQK